MTLREKLEKIQNSPKESIIDWDKSKRIWIESVDTLFNSIKNSWLIELVNQKLLEIKTSSINLVEEHLGRYSIDKIEISFDRYSIVLEPVGQNIIGGEGRIDIYLKGVYSEKVMLILSRENGNDNWLLIDTGS